MKSTFCLFALGALAVVSASALADGSAVVTRSTADMEADLMRTFQTHGGTSAGNIRVRSEEDANADLIRDWSAKPSTTLGKSVHSRAAEESFADLMRIWGPVAVIQ